MDDQSHIDIDTETNLKTNSVLRQFHGPRMIVVNVESIQAHFTLVAPFLE